MATLANTRPRPGKVLSTNPDTVRVREWRARKREERERLGSSAAPYPADAVSGDAKSSAVSPAPTMIPLHPTEPVKLDGGAIPFAALPYVAQADATDETIAEAPPLVGDLPQPEPVPPPGVTQEEAETIARIVTMFVAAGIGQMLVKRPELRQISDMPGTPMTGYLRHLDTVLAFHHQATVRVCMKYNLRIPYGDELIVATGMGVAAVGFAMKPNDAANKEAGSRAKDANPQPAEAPAATEPPQQATQEQAPYRVPVGGMS